MALSSTPTSPDGTAETSDPAKDSDASRSDATDDEDGGKPVGLTNVTD